MEAELFKRKPGLTFVEQFEEQWSRRSSAPVNRRSSEYQFAQLQDEVLQQHPGLTNLQLFGWVRGLPRGAALWRQMHDNSEMREAVARDPFVAKGQRVEIRKVADPGAMTGRQLAAEQLATIRKRYEAQGLAPDAAWSATLRDPDGQKWAARYQAPNAHLTVAEATEATRAAVRATTVDIAKAIAGQPITLHDAVIDLQKREGIADYRDALARVVADPRHRGLVEKYQQGRA